MNRTKGKAALILTVALLASCGSQNNNSSFTEDGFTVTINYNDGVARPRAYYVAEGETMSDPGIPEAIGKSFLGFYTALEGGEKITFPYTPTSNVTIYAHWETLVLNVVFDWNAEGLSSFNKIVEVEYNHLIDEKKIPTAEEAPENPGFNFRYWTNSPNGGAPADFTSAYIRNDLTYYAYWLADDVKIYTVSFDLNYEGAPTDQYPSVEYEATEGAKPLTVIAPKRDGYDFLGWSTDAEGTNIVIPADKINYTPTESVTLYAQWKVKTFKITFRDNVRDVAHVFYSMNDVPYGSQINAPDETPTRDGYTFDGWYTAQYGGAKVEFPYTVTRAGSIFAHWKSNPVTTSRFDAEYTVIDPNLVLPGYSGEATGVGCIVHDDDGSLGATTAYPAGESGDNLFVSYQYKSGATLTFTFNSSVAVNDAKVSLRLAQEGNQPLTFGPESIFTGADSDRGNPYAYSALAYEVSLNGKALSYSPITIAPGAFSSFILSSSLNLVAGVNTITLKVTNSVPFSGTMTATGPMVDYIEVTNFGASAISWSPEYDNPYRSA